MEKTKNRAPRAHDLLLQRLVFCKSNKLLVPFTVELVVGPTGYLIGIRHVATWHGKDRGKGTQSMLEVCSYFC